VKNYLTLLNHGSKIGGAAVGGAIGSLTGPAGTATGAAVGAAVGEACVVVLDDLAQRFLSPREEQRVAGVAALAIDGIRERLLWKQRRADDFFDGDVDCPSPAEELFEGTLLAAKQEHEQLKLPYLAHFYTNLVFSPTITKQDANYLLSLAEALTYHQFCILALVDQITGFQLRSKAWENGVNVDPESFHTTQQALYLYQRQLIVSFSNERGRGANIYEAHLLVPCQAIISGLGLRLSNLLELHRIPERTLRDIAARW
jgi:hypothetical protein